MGEPDPQAQCKDEDETKTSASNSIRFQSADTRSRVRLNNKNAYDASVAQFGESKSFGAGRNSERSIQRLNHGVPGRW